MDVCGNQRTGLNSITVEDTTRPVITCPADVQVECDENLDPATLGEATATDNCTDPGTDISYSDTQLPGSCPNSYTIERTWTAVDECGNQSTCLQIITVEDTTPPVITCPSDVTAECSDDLSPASLGEATATDNCTDPVTDISYSDNQLPGSCPNSYTIERTWTAVDECRNSSNCVQIIIVEDTTPPVVTCPADVQVECDENLDPASLGEATATDNCTDPVTDISYSDNQLPCSCPNRFSIDRTWTVVVESCYQLTCLQVITVEDTTPPVITCPSDVTAECSDDLSPASLGEATATDNCTDPVTEISYSDNQIP